MTGCDRGKMTENPNLESPEDDAWGVFGVRGKGRVKGCMQFCVQEWRRCYRWGHKYSSTAVATRRCNLMRACTYIA